MGRRDSLLFPRRIPRRSVTPSGTCYACVFYPLSLAVLSLAVPSAAAQTLCSSDDYATVFETDVQQDANASPALVLTGPYDIPTSGASMTVRIHVHLLRNSDGTGGMRAPRVAAVLSRIRRDLAPRGISLVEAGRSEIDNTAWANDPDTYFSDITATDSHADRIDVYLTALPPAPCSPPPPRAFGKATGIPGSGMVFGYYNGVDDPLLPDPASGEDDYKMNVASHEMGHALGLFHTYHWTLEGSTTPTVPAPCPELVNGSNGDTCGDYVRDTPADPTDEHYVPQPMNWGSTPTCALIRGTPNVDPNGAPYMPRVSNLMSQFRPECATSFTPGQGARMIAVTLVQNGAVVQEATVPATLHVPTGFATVFSASTVRFGQGASLSVSGLLGATATTFTPLNAAQGWGGLSVPGGTLTLGAGSVVSGVVTSTAAVAVSGGGSAILDRVQVLNTSGGGAGLLVSGRRSSARISGASLIYRNRPGPGVRADAGAQVTIDSDDVEIYNNGEGIVATGTGSSALVLGGNIHENYGPGLRASSGGRVNVLRDAGSGTSSFATTAQPVRVIRNIGGLYAIPTGKQGGGVIWSGDYVCVQAPCPSIGGHRFDFNSQPQPGGGPVYDALALSASRVTAPHNYWNGRTSAQVLATSLADKSSSIDVSDALLTPPAAGSGASGRASAPTARITRDGGTPQAAGRLGTGRVDAAVQALLAEADGLVQAGDSTLAATRIIAAYGIVTSEDDRLAVAEAAGRTLAAVQPPALIAWAAALTAAPADRPWGRRALAAGLTGQGHTAEALAVAQALADENGAGSDSTAISHRSRGLGIVVEAAVEAGDGPRAVQALADLADVDAEGAAELALSVALAFPEETVGAGRGVAQGRSASSAGSSDAPASDKTAAQVVDLVAVPNPSAGAVRVTLALGTAAEARVEVFDALGRRVALLHDGPASGTFATSFDGSAFPAGVYVVRAVVRSAGGSSSVVARRVVVTR